MVRIRDYRLRMGLTMKELGAMVGVSESAVGLWENGKRKPNYEKMLQLSEALGCTVSDLLGEESPAYENEEEYSPEITMIARAGKKMSPAQKRQMIAVLKAMFPDEFEP